MSGPGPIRISPGADGVSIWSEELFGGPGSGRLRAFVAGAFAVSEVETIEIRRGSGFGRLRYRPSAVPGAIWRKLAQALRGDAPADERDSLSLGPDTLGVARLYLDHPASWPLHVSRVADTLSTWRIRDEGHGRLRISHPVLRRSELFSHRLEEKLAAILGVEDVRARSWSSDVVVAIDGRTLTPSRLARELETAWPALIEGGGSPPSAKRLVAAGTLLTLATAGQFAVPALRPVAVAAVVVYSAPNVAAAVRQLRHGVIGLPALYSFGLGLMLMSGLPLTGTIMASLMQLWPYLAHRTIVNRQRRLFSAHRRLPVWAKVAGTEVETHVDDLRPGDEVVVREGELVPVDGVVTDGLGVLADPFAAAGSRQEAAPGRAVLAGARLLSGSLVVRVTRSGGATAAAHVGAVLPYAAFRDLPSLYEAERVANRNAKPALALAALNLLTVRAPRFSQAVIRPDYVTAPRLSAQLTALHDIADALRRGLLIRRPAALDVLPAIEVVAFDDHAGPQARSVVAALARQDPRLRFVHISSRRKQTARAAADAAGIEFALGGLSAEEKAQALRGIGRSTLWIGEGASPDARAAMAASDVSVSLSGFARAPDDAADILLLRGELASVLELQSLARAHRGWIERDYRAVYAANLVGVAGAFMARFGSLQSGLLSNLGSGVVYARHVRRLNALIREIEMERARLSD